MRFVLDHDLDVGECRKVLVKAGHEVLTAYEGGVEGDDDDVTAYALEKGAAVLTHDKEFTRRRVDRPVGLHVQLRCNEWDAASCLEIVEGRVSEILARFDDLTVIVSADGTDIHLNFPNQGRQTVRPEGT